MSTTQSDAFVFFGATGDLAYKKIFPALQALIHDRHLGTEPEAEISSRVNREGWPRRASRSRRSHHLIGFRIVPAFVVSARLLPVPGRNVGDVVDFDNPHLTRSKVMALGKDEQGV